jgi:hypothetical protein
MGKQNGEQGAGVTDKIVALKPRLLLTILNMEVCLTTFNYLTRLQRANP